MWLAFVLAGAAAGLTAYSYARLGSLRPKNSPEFQYTSLAFGPRAGFVAGWLMLIADLLAIATVALGFGGYLAHLLGTRVVASAVGVVLVSGLVVLVGTGESIGLALALTLVEAAGLLFVVVIGLPDWPRLHYLDAPEGFGGLSAAAALIFFAYLGFDELGNLAEEMERPERDLPRALAVSMVGATLIYVLVALSATAAVPWKDLAASDAPLALVAQQVLGDRADAAISVIALAATGNTVLLLLVAAARSVHGMAAAGVLPAVLGRIGGRRVPLRATLAVLAVTVALVLIGDLARAASLTDGTVLASFVLVNLSLPWLAARRVAGGTGTRRALDLVLPLLAVALCGWLLLHTGWPSLAATAAFAVVGLLVGRPRPDRVTPAPPRAPARQVARPR